MADFYDEIRDEAEKVFFPLEIALKAQAVRTAVTLEEFIQIQRAAGIADEIIEQALLNDLNTGGRIFGEFINSLNLNVSGRMNELANKAAKIEFGRNPKKKKVWIAALVNTCPDCLPRHNQVDTEENWEIRGEPASGWSVCRSNCQCQLLDIEDVEGRPELEKPLERRR